jgi:hypothetical protein
MTTKTTGLGDHLWITGRDVANDTSTITVSSPVATIDVTGIDKFAHERILGLRDGKFDLTTHWNSGVGGIHSVLSPLPTTDIISTYCRGYGLGSPAASIVAKQLNYDPTRGTDGSLTEKSELDTNGYATDWGVQLTNGARTDTTATNGAAWDFGGGFTTPAVPASGTPVTNTSAMPAQVVISGGTMTNVSVNGVTVGTGAGTYTVPAGQAITLTYTAAPTWTWALQTSFGWQAYLHVSAFTGTSATIKLQDSADNTTFADVASGAFAAVTGGVPLAQRIAVGGTATLRRYVRVATTGTFTTCTFLVQVTQNISTTVF